MKLDDLIGHIVCADCLEVLKNIPDESIDLVCTDCPYRVVAGGVTDQKVKDDNGLLKTIYTSDGTRCSNAWLRKDGKVPSAIKNGKMFANNEIKFEDWLPEVYRVLKEKTHCYIMINGRNLAELQKQAEKVGFKYQQLLVWEKGNATPNKWYLQACEFILMLRKGGERWINDLGQKTILKVPNIIGDKCHPTEKPVELMEVLIANSTNENDIVLEPFASGGSTCIAARNLKRRFIGIEIDEQYAKVANERLEQAQRQQMLF